MREILFKAKRWRDGKWVYGDLNNLQDSVIIHWYNNGCRVSDEVDPSTVCQYTNIDIRREAWPSSEVHKIFTGDMLGEWGEDEDGNECVCILGVVTYWEDEGRYVLADENGLCNDWTLEDKAKPENWPNLIHGGNIHDGEGGQHEE